jgi:hypothetical protein
VFGVLLGAVVGTSLHEAFSPEALQRWVFDLLTIYCRWFWWFVSLCVMWRYMVSERSRWFGLGIGWYTHDTHETKTQNPNTPKPKQNTHTHTHIYINSYGFRIPFLCGFLVALAGFGLHKLVPDVPEIEEDVGPGSPPTSPRRTPSAKTGGIGGGEGGTVVDTSGSSGGSSSGGVVGGNGNRVGALEVEGTAAVPAVAAAGQATSSSSGIVGGIGDGSGDGNNAPALPNPLKDLMRAHKLELCMGTAVVFLFCTAFYECLVWLPVRWQPACGLVVVVCLGLCW